MLCVIPNITCGDESYHHPLSNSYSPLIPGFIVLYSSQKPIAKYNSRWGQHHTHTCTHKHRKKCCNWQKLWKGKMEGGQPAKCQLINMSHPADWYSRGSVAQSASLLQGFRVTEPPRTILITNNDLWHHFLPTQHCQASDVCCGYTWPRLAFVFPLRNYFFSFSTSVYHLGS